MIQRHFKTEGFLFVLTSIYWREAWKYGERAFRYSNHDIGHAIAAASFAANLLGWKITYLHESSDEEISKILGFHKIKWTDNEKEYPEALFYVHPANAKDVPTSLTPDIIQRISELSFQGEANQLSKDHVNWEIITEVARATLKPRVVVDRPSFPNTPYSQLALSRFKATQIIRQRRSLLACDGVTSISKAEFLTMLDKTLPRETTAPFDVGLGPVRVHLFLFVHRVRDLAPGYYMFVRDEKDLEGLRLACHPNFLWESVEKDFPLYLLAQGKFTGEATSVSCQQPIAGEGAFSLGMIAKFRAPVEENPFLYRHLFWETGMIGQVLYLEAEAHGVRSTGIGCFFDDPVHELLALKDNQFQSLYHFTVGGPVEDKRLQSWAPYSHLEEGGNHSPHQSKVPS